MSAVLNPANAITAARYAAVPAFALWLYQGHDQLAMVALVWAAALDLVDGAVARKLGCASSFGELFDAISDAVIYGFMLGMLTLAGRLPGEPIAAIAALAALNIVFRLVYARRAGRPTNYRSYAMERTLGYVVYLIGFGLADFMVAFFSYGCLAVMFIVVAHDARRMLVDPVPP